MIGSYNKLDGPNKTNCLQVYQCTLDYVTQSFEISLFCSFCNGPGILRNDYLS